MRPRLWSIGDGRRGLPLARRHSPGIMSVECCRRIVAVVLTVLTALVAARHAAAQSSAGPSQTPDVAALSRLVEEQRKLLEAQGRVIEDLTRRLDDTTKLVAASQQRLADL